MRAIENQLEMDIKEIRDKLKTSDLKKPIVIEVSGTPKSGKTTYIESLKVFLRRNGIKVKSIHEGASICPIEDKSNWFFNVWTLNYAINSLVENIFSPVPEMDVLIFERALFDSICWFKWFKKKESLNEDEFRKIIDFISMEKYTGLIDMVCVMKADAETALTRENENMIVLGTGTIMNSKTISEINEIIDEALEEYSVLFKNKVFEIDTSNYTINEKNITITKLVLENIKEMLASAAR